MIYDFKNEDALVYVRSLPSASIDLGDLENESWKSLHKCNW